jgi:hypothetical protein
MSTKTTKLGALYLSIIVGGLWSSACQVRADPISNFTCVPDKTPRDPNDLLAAYNVFRGRYITPVPGSTAIHKAEVVDRCMFIAWTRYSGVVPGVGPGVDHAYVLTKDVGFDCAFTLTELGPDFAPIGMVGRIDFAKLRYEYKSLSIGVRAIGEGEAVCDGPRVEAGILLHRNRTVATVRLPSRRVSPVNKSSLTHWRTSTHIFVIRCSRSHGSCAN